MTEMQRLMFETCWKKVRVTCTDGMILEGQNEGYTQPLDNEPEVAAICIKQEGRSGLIEITEPEIEKIEIIE